MAETNNILHCDSSRGIQIRLSERQAADAASKPPTKTIVSQSMFSMWHSQHSVPRISNCACYKHQNRILRLRRSLQQKFTKLPNLFRTNMLPANPCGILTLLGKRPIQPSMLAVWYLSMTLRCATIDAILEFGFDACSRHSSRSLERNAENVTLKTLIVIQSFLSAVSTLHRQLDALRGVSEFLESCHSAKCCLFPPSDWVCKFTRSPPRVTVSSYYATNHQFSYSHFKLVKSSNSNLWLL
jgi:hypothetical protein